MCHVLVRWLVSLGAELELKDKKGCTPLLRASEYGFTEIVSTLLEGEQLYAIPLRAGFDTRVCLSAARASVTTRSHNLETGLFVG